MSTSPYPTITRDKIKTTLQSVGTELITIGVVDNADSSIDITTLYKSIVEQRDILIALTSNIAYDTHKGHLK